MFAALLSRKPGRRPATLLSALLRDESGATAIEYALIAVLIAIAAIAGFQSLGNELLTTFSSVSSKMNDVNSRA
ncbi:Flp family type IVb pilin [Altererythrobacter sp.]|uniref:Flp family type IVb pilin n=1 Tax=Altererythrobacter sp. TaxID=1872480 RepID=UPI003D01E85F